MSISAIKNLREKYEVLGSIQENERLCVRKEAFSKYSSPIFDEEQQQVFILKQIMHVLSYLGRLCQALHRRITKQKTTDQIREIERVVNQTLDLMAKGASTENFYEQYREFTQLKEAIENSVQGLKAFKKTEVGGKLELSKPDDVEVEKRRRRLNRVINSINFQLKPLINQLINRLDQRVQKPDLVFVHRLLDELETTQTCLGPNHQHLPTMFTRKVVREALTDRYGETVVDYVMDVYGMNNRAILSDVDINSLLVGIVVNINKFELRDLFEKRYGKDAVLDRKAFCNFLTELRKLNLEKVSHFLHDDLPYQDQLDRDLQFLMMHQVEMKEYGPKNRNGMEKLRQRFGYVERLSRFEVYYMCQYENVKVRPGMLSVMHDRNFKLMALESESIYHENGMYGVLFLPVAANAKEPGKVVFRGTYDQASVKRDAENFLSMRGPGGQSFEKQKEKLVQEVLQKTPISVRNLEFIGHSLGGADAQRMHISLTNALGPDSKRFEKFSVYPFNSPGINKRKAKGLDLRNKNLQHQIVYFDRHKDFVQMAGEAKDGFLSKKVGEQENLKVTIMHFNRDEGPVEEFVDDLTSLLGSTKYLPNFLKMFFVEGMRRKDNHVKPLFTDHDDTFHGMNRDRKNTTWLERVVTNQMHHTRFRAGIFHDEFVGMTPYDEIRPELVGRGYQITKSIDKFMRRVVRPIELFERAIS